MPIKWLFQLATTDNDDCQYMFSKNDDDNENVINDIDNIFLSLLFLYNHKSLISNFRQSVV